ncbi:MAG: polysaccharide biosynthesis protein [Chloroflexi bacterium CSP1-4]|nr:MAG: polysaccharide biosynthesis protein [Chloroflexi bacterium CSP1-4]
MALLARLRGRVHLDASADRTARAVLVSSVSLVAGKVAVMGFGFLSWVVAARLYPVAEFGLAAGAVAAVTLCAQLALLGVGSAIITLLPVHEGRPGRLLDGAITLLAASSALAGLGFLLFAGTALEELSVVAAQPVYALLFLLLAVSGTLGVLFDQASTARRQGVLVMSRGVAAGLCTLVAVAAIGLAGTATTSLAIFAAWVAGGLVTAIGGLWTMRRVADGYRYRPVADRALSAALIRVGLPNYALTLAERAPGFVLPVIVVELLSPAANAAWYAAWMMAWVVFIIPIQVGMTSFAEIARAPERTARIVRNGIRTSLGLGAVAATGLAVLAGPILGLLGEAYAATAEAPLRILVIGFVPVTFILAYFSLCRARRRLREAIVLGAVDAAASILLPAAVAQETGLVGMAIAWLAVQVVVALVALVRLRRLTRLPAD